jgi:hypothetical protein
LLMWLGIRRIYSVDERKNDFGFQLLERFLFDAKSNMILSIDWVVVSKTTCILCTSSKPNFWFLMNLQMIWI